MYQLTEFLDNLYTTTWQNMKSTVRDNFFDATPFYFWLRDRGRVETIQGGRWISEPLSYAQNDNVAWIGKGGTTAMNDYEFLTVAKYDWRYLVAPIVRFGIDDQQNRGRNLIMSLMNSKMDNTQNSLVSELESRLAAASGAAASAIDGLQLLVADDPTAAGVVGGIEQSTAANSWWRNKTSDMTGVSFAASGVDRMRTMFNNTMNNLKMDMIDIIVTSQTVYEYYEDAVLGFYQTQNNKLGDVGFQNIEFKGAPIIWSPNISQRMYFLNTNFIKFVYDPGMFFDMTEWKAIPEQVNDRVAQIVTACQHTVSRRICQGVIHTIDTA